MYNFQYNNQIECEDFVLPFGGKLNENNRWVKLAKIIPWQEIEKEYSKCFTNLTRGCKALPARVALGTLIIKEQLGLSDRETVALINEHPYLQYFLGFCSFMDEIPIDHSLLTHFRKRFSEESLKHINEMIVKNTAQER